MIKISNIDDTKEFVNQLRAQMSTTDLTNLTSSDVFALKT